MTHRLWFAVLVSIGLATPSAAIACSVTPTFIPSTNYELVADAGVIAVAHADAAIANAIQFTVVSIVKGSGLATGDTLELEGISSYSGAGPRNDFSKARPGAFAGGCIAYDYKIGGDFLLFLTKYNGAWRVVGEPFSRVNEEVDPGDAWLAAVREYTRIAALPTPAERTKALHALAARVAKPSASPAERALADDLAAHFAAATPHKSFAELEAMLDASPGDSRILLAIGLSGDPAARALMSQRVDQLAASANIDRQALEAISSYYAKVADPAAMAKLAALYVALGPKLQELRWPVMWLLIRHADASQQATMERALAGATDEEAGRLSAWFVKHRSEVARKELNKRIAGNYETNTDITFGLAGAGDTDVIKWAQAKLAAPSDENRWIAAYVIARSPLPTSDATARKIIAAGGGDLLALTQGYSAAVHAHVDARLADIDRGKPTGEVATWLARTRYERAHPTD